MRSLHLAMQLLAYRGSSSSDSTDLYEMAEGTTEADITPYIRRETEERYREWVTARDAAMAVRALIDETRGGMTGGPLLQDGTWRGAIAVLQQKYAEYRRACATRLPMSLEHFERAFGRRGSGMTRAQYRQLVLVDDPIGALAARFGVSREEVEATRLPPRKCLEWTFLARVINRYAFRQEAKACVELTLQLIDRLVSGTYSQTFAKTKIVGDGSSSHEFSMFSMDIEELEALTRYVHAQSQPSGHDGDAAAKVLKALELVWHIPIPEVVREEWLDVDPRKSVVRLLAPPPQTSAPADPSPRKRQRVRDGSTP